MKKEFLQSCSYKQYTKEELSQMDLEHKKSMWEKWGLYQEYFGKK